MCLFRGTAKMMRQAGYCILISAALQGVALGFAGFAEETRHLLFPAVLYVLLYAGLARGKMWVAWLAFISLLGGSAGALSELLSASSVRDWVLWGILGADLLAAFLLFGAIWAGRAHEDAGA